MPFVFYGGAEVLLLYFTLWTLAENVTDLMFIACSMRRCLCRGLEIEEDVFARSGSCNTGRVLRAQRQRTWCIITLYFLMASSSLVRPAGHPSESSTGLPLPFAGHNTCRCGS